MELNNLQQEAHKLRLTLEEKQAMRRQIFGMPSPLAPSRVEGSPYFIFSYQFLQARVLVPAMAFVLVFVGGGTAAAAQGALPGDLLYPVKLSINETVEVALATTPVARAEVSQKLAERRIEEAEALAAQGELDAQTGETLAASFEQHAQKAEELASEVEAQDPAAAAQLRTKLGSSLSAHGAILATLTAGSAQANQDGAGAVAVRVLARADTGARAAFGASTRSAKSATPAVQTTTMSLMVAEDATGTADASVSLEGDMIEGEPSEPAEESAALELRARAAEALSGAQARFEDDKKNLEDAAITHVSGELVGIEKLMEQGSTTLVRGDYKEAKELFGQALKQSIEITVLLRAQERLERNIITPILEQKLIINIDEERLEASVIRSLPDF